MSATATLAAATLLAACSSSGSSGGSTSTPLGTALSRIHSTPQTAGYLEFGDTARLAALNNGTTDLTSPFGRLLGMGSSELQPYAQFLTPLTGFDLMQSTTAVSVGQPPKTVNILYGTFDPAAVGARLSAMGYRRQDRGDGVTAWVWRDDHQLDLSKLDPTTGIGPGMQGWLNVVWVSGSRIAFGGATADLSAALPEQSKPLSGDPVVGALADCLGPAVAATVVADPKTLGDPSVPPIAFGITAISAADTREEMCVAAPDDATAQKYAAAFTTAVGTGKDFRTMQPWSALLADPKTDLLGGGHHTVRLSARPVDTGHLNLIFTLVATNSYQPLLGLPTPARNGRVVLPDGTLSSAPTP